MPEINGKTWTKGEVHAALKDGRVDDLWPGATFVEDPSGVFGKLTFADGSRAKINFEDSDSTGVKINLETNAASESTGEPK